MSDPISAEAQECPADPDERSLFRKAATYARDPDLQLMLKEFQLMGALTNQGALDNANYSKNTQIAWVFYNDVGHDLILQPHGGFVVERDIFRAGEWVERGGNWEVSGGIEEAIELFLGKIRESANWVHTLSP